MNKTLKYILFTFFLINLALFVLIYKQSLSPELLYRFNNSKDANLKAQKVVKSYIDSTFVPWWQKSKADTKLSEYLKKSNKDVYSFIFQDTKKDKDSLLVDAISSSEPYKVMRFRVDNDEVVGFELRDKEFKVQKTRKILQKIEATNGDYELFESLVELKILAGNISRKYYDSNKTKEYFSKEVDRMISKKAKQKIENFSKKYPLIANLLEIKSEAKIFDKRYAIFSVYHIFDNQETLFKHIKTNSKEHIQKQRELFEKYRPLIELIYKKERVYKPNSRYLQRFNLKIDLYEACDSGDTKSCLKLGYAYSDGWSGYKKDIKKAKEYFKKGCELGDNISCLGLGRIYKKSNKKKAKEIFEKIISSKSNKAKDWAYYYLAFMEKKGKDAYLLKSCQLELFRACCKVPRKLLFDLDVYKNYKHVINNICEIKVDNAK